MTPKKRFVLMAAFYVACDVASAALPSTHSLGRVAPTPSGVVNSKYRNGDDGTPAIPLLWGTCPAISLTEADTISYNLRSTCSLSEAGSPLATISIFSGTLPTGCVMADLAGADGINDGFTCTTPTATTASLVARATRNADTANSAAFQIAVTATGTDTTAPTIPLALTGADNADGTATLTWEASSDPRVSGVVTGVASYRIQKDGGTVATVTAPSANVQPALTEQLVGADDGKAYTQTGASHALTFGGTGLGATTDQFLARGASVTGDFTATAKITAYTPTSGTAGSIGIWAGASATSGAMYAAARWRDTDDKCNLRTRTSTGGTAANGTLSAAYTLPVWLKLTRVSDLFSAYCSSDGVSWTLTSSQTFGLGSSAIVGPFITSGSAGNTATGTVAEFNLHQASTVGTTYTGTSGSFTVSSYDGANRSAESTAAAVTITGGAASTLIAVPAATKTVCSSGCDFTPSQLSTIISSAANASANGIAAGESIELRAATAGGTEEWATRIACNGVSGTSANPIWVAVRDGDKIRFDTPTPASVGLVDLTDCDYWSFVGSRDGTATNLEIGDSSYHQPGCAQVGGSTFGCYPHSRSIMVRSSTGVAFVGTTIHGAKEHDSSVIDKDSAKILFKYVAWSYDGHNAYNVTSTTLEGKTSDSKDMAHICATNVVMQDVRSHHAGHTPAIACGPYHVYRRTTWDGNWADHTTTPEYTGNHAATLIPGNHRSDYNTTTRFGPLVEDSLFYGSGSEPEHKTFQETIQLLGVNVIFRGNYIVQRAGTGNWGYFGPQAMSLCASAQVSTSLRMAYVHAYHNTLWGGQVTNNSGSIGGTTTGHPADQCAGFKFKNNLFQGMQDGRLPNSAYAVHFQAPADYTGYSNGWKGAEWFGNVFGQHPTLPSSYYQVRLNVSAGGTGSGTAALTNGVDANGDYDCADGGDSGTWPSNWCGNVSSALQWANATTTPIANGVTDALPDPDTMRSVLTLSGSATYGIGDAWPLTTTTDAGTADTTLTLASARYFYDGWDNEDYTWGGLHTEYPDCICVGPTSASTVAQCNVTQIQTDSIDYSTGAVTVSPGVTHEVGSRVWQAKVNSNGSCGAVVDNRGAAQ